jgi:preprotein translocase subunit SecA
MVTADIMHGYERIVMLGSLDTHWREHLAALDHLRQGIHLRGYAQKSPKQEYKREAFELFSNMLESVKRDVTLTLMNVQIRSSEEVEAVEAPHAPENMQYHHADYEEALASGEQVEEEHKPFVRGTEKVGRNDPCPCGSGKKYKQCHGKLS